MKSQPHNSFLFSCLIIVFMAFSSVGATEVQNFESLKILEMKLPSYPMKMTFEGIYGGQARVVFSVDERGELIDVFQESYTHPEFGRLAAESIWKWKFQPSKLNGEPITVVKAIDFNFDDKRGVFSSGIIEAAAAKLNFGRHAKSKQMYGPNDLDEELQAIEMGAPFFPEEFKNSDVDGMATVVFYIDEKGETRLPYTSEYSHLAFGQSAVHAVLNWKFKPPTVNGKPASILVRQQFNFKDATP